MKRAHIGRGIGCVPILRLSLHFVSAALTRWWWIDVCVMTSRMIFLFYNNCIFCRPLHRSVILSSGSTLRSSLKTRNRCRNCCGGRQRTRRWWRRDAERRLQKRSTRKRRKGDVLLRTGGEGEEAWACTSSESNDGGESWCPEEGKVASLHSVVSMTC